MQTNKMKAKIRAGEKTCGVAFTYPMLQAVEIIGNLDFDFVHIEGEHGAFNLRDVEEMCMLANAKGLTVTARVPNIHPSTILGFLDRGVQGIVGPHVRTRADAEAVCGDCSWSGDCLWMASRKD